jgi:hypothetical protein
VERRGDARGRSRGGEDIPAARPPYAGVALGAAAVAAGTGVAALPLARADHEALVEIGYRVAAVALLALVAALALRWVKLVPVALLLLGGMYGAQLAVDDAPLDPATPLVAVLLFLTAELAYWSLEERAGARTEPGELLRRVAVVAGSALGALLVAAMLLALVDGVRTGGLAVDLLGAAAAAATLIAIALFARQQSRAS